MAFNFFDKVGRKKNKESSDDKPEKYIKFDKNSMELPEEETVPDFENTPLPDEFNINPNSSMRFLWNRYNDEENSEETSFEPMEFIRKPILEAHFNMCRNNPDIDLDKLDPNEADLLGYIDELQKLSLRMCEQIVNENAQHEEEYTPAPVDAKAFVRLSKNKVRAWLYIVPPRNGGRDISVADIERLMNENNITHGIVKGIIDMIVSQKLYFKLLEIARGTDPIDGRNGSVEELFSRKKEINLKEDAHGNVNYKELNLIKSVRAGDVICNITLPTKAVSGRAVDGSVVYGADGEFPDVPKGENTGYSEDGTSLIADIGGEVVFEEGKFNVRRLLIIENDVDNSIGNIDFTGDLLIKGGVREGFSVKTEGNIKIEGTVEGAHIISGGDIVIKRGMTGGNKGYMEAGGTIECIFLENCRAYAKGSITVEQVMYSEVASDDAVIITGGKGSAIGGKIIAGKLIEAKTIGAMANSYLKTQVMLGVTPSMLKEEKSLKARLDDIDANIFKISQNINYIEKNIDSATDERKDMLEEFKAQLKVRELQKINTEHHLNELKKEMELNIENCKLKCKELFPIVIINVNGSSQIIDYELTDCIIYRKGEKSYLTSPDLGNIISF